MVEQINNDHTFKLVKLENEDVTEELPDNGAQLTGYFKGAKLYKIHTWLGLSSCIREYDYYLYNGKPCFVYETEQDFYYDEKTDKTDQTKLIKAFEGRYYVNNNALLEVKLKGVRRFEEIDKATLLKELNDDVKLYTKKLTAHLKNKLLN